MVVSTVCREYRVGSGTNIEKAACLFASRSAHVARGDTDR